MQAIDPVYIILSLLLLEIYAIYIIQNDKIEGFVKTSEVIRVVVLSILTLIAEKTALMLLYVLSVHLFVNIIIFLLLANYLVILYDFYKNLW